MTINSEQNPQYDPDLMLYAPMYMAFYHEAQRQLTRFMELWNQMPDMRTLLHYETPVTRETCTQIIGVLRQLHTTAQDTADDVDRHPAEAMLPTRRAMRRLVEEIDALVLHLVVFREQCSEVSVPVLCQRHDLMTRFEQVRTTLFAEALPFLEADAEECNVGEEFHLERGPTPATDTPEAVHPPQVQQQDKPVPAREEEIHARV